MFESDGVPLEIAQESLRLAAQKLPVKTKFVVRRDYVEKVIMKNSEIKALSLEELKEQLKHREHQPPES